MYGPGGMALYHHCGKDNMGVNNIVHKTDRLSYMFGGCNKGPVTCDVHKNGLSLSLPLLKLIVFGFPSSTQDVIKALPPTKVHTERPQQYDNFRNIYYLENTDDFTFGRNSDRYYESPPNFYDNLYWSQVPGDEELPKGGTFHT